MADLADIERRVAALEAAQQHVATKADLAGMELRIASLMVRSFILATAFNGLVTVASIAALGWLILQRLPAGGTP